MSRNRLLLLTPPLLQPNCPYPATMHLTGFLEERGFDVHQRDLSVKVALDVLREYGGEEADGLCRLRRSEVQAKSSTTLRCGYATTSIPTLASPATQSISLFR